MRFHKQVLKGVVDLNMVLLSKLKMNMSKQ